MLVFSFSVFIFLTSLFQASSESRYPEDNHPDDKRKHMPSFKPSSPPTKLPTSSITAVPSGSPIPPVVLVCPYAYSYAILPPLGFLASK